MYKAKNILVVNKSTCLPNTEIARYIVAVQSQISEHFGPIWGYFATLKLVAEEDIRRYPGAWVIWFLDYPPQDATDLAGILGYHDVLVDGTPVAYIFAKLEQEYKIAPSVTFSHEVLEMLADAYTTWCALIGNTLYCIEVCDAVEDDDDGYNIGDVRVSNFVYPEWFDPRSTGKRVDFVGKCRHPLHILDGGYMSVFEIGKDHSWRNIGGAKARRLALKTETRAWGTRKAKRNNLIQMKVD